MNGKIDWIKLQDYAIVLHHEEVPESYLHWLVTPRMTLLESIYRVSINLLWSIAQAIPNYLLTQLHHVMLPTTYRTLWIHWAVFCNFWSGDDMGSIVSSDENERVFVILRCWLCWQKRASPTATSYPEMDQTFTGVYQSQLWCIDYTRQRFWGQLRMAQWVRHVLFCRG